MWNICCCGAEAGYPHASDCPYPLYRGTEAQYDRWLAARFARREGIEVGERDGEHWAEHNGYRVISYAEGGYCCQVYFDGEWWADNDGIPEDVERYLCRALGIEFVA